MSYLDSPELDRIQSEMELAVTPSVESASKDFGNTILNRRLFSAAIVGFAIWYFGFRKKRGAK